LPFPHDGFHRVARARVDHENQRSFGMQKARRLLRHHAKNFLKIILLAERAGQIDQQFPFLLVCCH
jgi:hypothetical protein